MHRKKTVYNLRKNQLQYNKTQESFSHGAAVVYRARLNQQHGAGA